MTTIRVASSILFACWTVLTATDAAAGPKLGAPARPRPTRRQDVAAWNHLKLATPTGVIPANAFSAMAAGWKQMPSFGGATGTPFGGAAWTQIGPAPIETPTLTMGPNAGRVAGLVIDPTSAGKTMFVGFAHGGVWRTTDGGATWTAVTDAQQTLTTGALALDPKDPKTIYVGTGEGDNSADSFVGQGVLKSTDGGDTWTLHGADKLANAAISKIAVDPSDGAVYASTVSGFIGKGQTQVTPASLGLWKSKDGGVSWEQLVTTAVSGFEIVGSALFYHVPGMGSMKLDLVGGASTPVPNLPADSPYVRFSASAASAKTIYAGVAVNTMPKQGQVWVSIDGGASFKQIVSAPNYCRDQCDYDNIVLADAKVADTAYLGGSLCSVWKGTGLLGATPTWTAISMPTGMCAADAGNWSDDLNHPDVHAVIQDPSNPAVLYVGSDGGLSSTKDGGATWNKTANAGFATTLFVGLCLDPSDDTLAYGGLQDNGAIERKKGSTTWLGRATGDGGPCLAQPGGKVITTVQNGTTYQTTDGFTNNNEVFAVGSDVGEGPMPPTPPCVMYGTCKERVGFNAPLAGDPSVPDTVYLGTNHLWKSTMFGAMGSWTMLKTADLAVAPGTISAIAVAPSSSDAIYTGGTGGELNLVSADGATVKSLATPELPARYVTAIAVDPLDAKVVYVAYSGFNANTPMQPGHLFRSPDGGGSWKAIDNGLPDLPMNDLIAHPTLPGVLVAGTPLGVVVTLDGGVSWSKLDKGLPIVGANVLAFHKKANKLFVGTYGRSAFETTFSPTGMGGAGGEGGAGGASGSGGATSTGGNGGDAGASTSAGGAAAGAGGATANGGATSVGGAPSTGGATSTGGASAQGGSAAPGMATAQGGTGGAAATGAGGSAAAGAGPSAAPADSSGGCGCRTAGHEDGVPAAAGLALGALALVARRRRARRALVVVERKTGEDRRASA